MRQFLRRFPFSKTALKKNRLALSAGAFLCFAALFALWAGSLKIPDLGTFEERRVENSTKIYDRTGKILLYDVHQNIKRTVIPYSDMGANIKNATVAIEDRDFYEHGGVRFRSVIRAILVNLHLWPGYAGQGGSTITQQVIKNALLTKEKKISRKVKEWILATKLEQTMSKEDILTLYLNESPYGGPVYGIGEAASYYFGKRPSDLTVAEAAYLAALPQAPTYYSPYGKHRDELERRKNLVLSKMRELGFITAEEHAAAQGETVVFVPQYEGGAKALHFVMWVREYLAETYGEEALLSGLKVTTTLDYNLQKKAEEIVLAGALENEKKFNAKNAAMVAIDPKTGQVLVMVGSRDYFDKEIEGNFNVALAHRQPGSSFKPVVYATAFMKGYTPETVLFDLP
ncbi:MAG: transglycosylase domain-containing protein, partial [bacterium]|nr:transglycosylase domain-containing protein [bacterium]